MKKHLGFIGAVTMVPFGGALAQAPASSGLEEIVVTAQRRAENLQEVPVTVTAVTNDQLASSGITNIQSLAQLVPSLSVIDPTGFTMPFIRGVGTSTLGGGTFASVATYIDGVYVARTTNALFELDNVENVQVLAGPQGALYGRNATSGAIVITTQTPKPGDPVSGSATASFGNFDYRGFSAKISGGLGDKFAVSLSGAKRDRDGFVKNLGAAVNNDDMDDRDSWSTAASLVFEPNDDMSFVLKGSYTRANDRASGGYQPLGLDVIVPDGPFAGLNDNQAGYASSASGLLSSFGLPPDVALAIGREAASNAVFSEGYREAYDNQRDSFTNGLLGGRQRKGSALYIDNMMLSLNSTFNLQNFAVRSVTGYTDSSYHGSVQVGAEEPGSATSAILGQIAGAPGPIPLDIFVSTLATGTPVNGGFGFSSIMPSHVISQGFQVLSPDSSRIKWIAGVDWSREEGKTWQSGDFLGLSVISAWDDWTVRSTAGFAQATIPFADRWSTTLGVRYTDEIYKISEDRVKLAPPLGTGRQPVFGATDDPSSKFTYTARLEYKADDWLAYGGIATGFKSAVLNGNDPGGLGGADQEEVQSIEVGIKRDFADRYRLNASVYYATYEGIQLNVIDQDIGGNILIGGPDAEVKGIDLQALARVTDNFQLTFSATALDAEFTKNNDRFQIKGNKLPGASDLTVSLVGDLHIPLGNVGDMNFTTTVTHNDGMYYDHLNYTGSGGTDKDSFDLVNLNLAYTSPDEHWVASLWANNVFDEEYYRTGIVAFDTPFGSYGRLGLPGNPRTYGVTLTAKF